MASTGSDALDSALDVPRLLTITSYQDYESSPTPLQMLTPTEDFALSLEANPVDSTTRNSSSLAAMPHTPPTPGPSRPRKRKRRMPPPPAESCYKCKRSTTVNTDTVAQQVLTCFNCGRTGKLSLYSVHEFYFGDILHPIPPLYAYEMSYAVGSLFAWSRILPFLLRNILRSYLGHATCLKKNYAGASSWDWLCDQCTVCGICKQAEAYNVRNATKALGLKCLTFLQDELRNCRKCDRGLFSPLC
jgi:hypothetical protein